MRKLMTSLCVLTFVCALHAQSLLPAWISNLVRPGIQRYVLDIATDSSGNAYVLEWYADTAQTPQYSAGTYILKYDGFGQLLWNVCLPPFGSSVNTKMVVGRDQNVYVAARDSNQFELTRILSTGTVSWSYNFPFSCYDIGGIATDDSMNIYLVGTSSTQDQAVILKVDSIGALVWSYSYSNLPLPIGLDRGKSVVVSRTGIVYATVSSLDSNEYHSRILSLSNSGQLLWLSDFYAGGYGDIPMQLQLFQDTMLVVTGVEMPTIGTADILIQRFDTSGNLVWKTTFNADSALGNTSIRPDSPMDMILTRAGNIAIVGKCCDSGMPVWMDILLNKSGSVIWWRQDFGRAHPTSVAEDNSGYLIFGGGAINPQSSQWGMGITKYDSLGNLLWSSHYTNANTLPYDPVHTTIDSAGNIFCSGGQHGWGNTMVTTLKYSFTVSITESEYLESQRPFPNPASTKLNFNFDTPDQTRQITLYSTDGKVISNIRATEPSVVLDVSTLPNGIYFYAVSSVQLSYSGKVVISR